MKFSHMLNRTQSNESLTTRKHVPWTASPLDKKVMGAETNGQMKQEEEEEEEEQKTTAINQRVLQFREGRPQLRDVPVFKRHHESSTIELFYDLFFVANLTTFTSNHEITTVQALTSYLGFFTLMWFTWLQTSLFDVRFSSDSVVNRLGKAVSFGIMTGFAVVGTLYVPDALDISNEESPFEYDGNAFQAMAIILMASRLALVVQYGIVFWYVKGYEKCKAPLLATMGSLFITAMVFLGTFWGFPDGHNIHTYVGWYVVIVIEAIAIIAISCVWRVVSFRHTHLVERVGLLTLIIMGEGIIGMTKSVATILQGSVAVTSQSIGQILSSVLLIYFIWILYFDQIENDRFGTIRQQIWALLHFPLHVAILFVVEGSSQFVIWNVINQYWNWQYNNFYNPDTEATAEIYIAHLQTNITAFDNLFKNELLDYYDYTANLTAMSKLNWTSVTDYVSNGGYGTDAYNESLTILNDLYNGLTEFIFYEFNVEVPEDKLKEATSTEERIDALQGVFITIFWYFLISAGVFLIILACMYWSGKKNKTKWEYVSIVVRTLFGLGIALVSVSLVTPFNANGSNSGYYLFYSPWMVPLVVIVYFIVIVLDNLLVWHSNKTISHALQYQRSRGQSHDQTV